MAISFAKAVKYEAKGRIALIGPAGSGKSFTMLTAARALAGKDGRIAAIDTEQGSLAKYADQFEFDVCPLAEFTAQNFLEALHAAEKDGYAVFCCDSLSHFWMGRGGALEFVDAASMRNRGGDGMSGWKEFRPLEREMTDAMITSPCHVICTMRTKTAYEEQLNPKTGKKQRVKIGLAPVQRDGLEYEFDLVGSMTEDNVLVVDKTRCSIYSGRAIDKPKSKDFEAFGKWLSGEPRPENTPKPVLVTKQADPIPDKTVTVTPVEWDSQKEWMAALVECLDYEQYKAFIAPLIKERTEDFVRSITPAMLSEVYRILPSIDSFNAEMRPLCMAAVTVRKEIVKAVAAEAKQRGYLVNRVTGEYEEGGKK